MRKLFFLRMSHALKWPSVHIAIIMVIIWILVLLEEKFLINLGKDGFQKEQETWWLTLKDPKLFGYQNPNDCLL